MTPAEWQRVQEVVDAALDLPAAARAAFLDRNCNDSTLRRQAEALIGAHDRAGDFLAAPIAERASELLTGTGDAKPAIAPGQTIQGYRIISEIGSGGMGVVLKAEDPVLGRLVALKILFADRLGGVSISRLIREARAASSLNHPNIVTIYGVIQSDDSLAIAMELVDGRSLRELCGSGLALSEATGITRQIALALAAAHEAGIVHRDVKPENIVVRPDGYVKVVDFGLARNMAPLSSLASATFTAGTLRYMSPEQLRGERATPASDVFALGLVLYETATGRHPFEAASAVDTAYAITRHQAPPASSANADVSAELDALIASMLAKEPQARPSARDVAAALEVILRPAPASSSRHEIEHAAQPAKRWRLWAAAGACALVAVGVWPLKKAPATAPAVRQTVRALGWNDPAAPRHVYAITRQGRLLVYVDNSDDRGGYGKWIAESTAAPPLQGVNWASFAQVFAGGDGVIYAVTLAGDMTYFRLLDPWRNKSPLRWSADSGRVIASHWDRFSEITALAPAAWVLPDGRSLVSHTRLVRGGVIWAKDRTGRVFLFQHGWDARGEVLPLSAAGADLTARYVPTTLPPGHNCGDCQVFEGGDGVMLALSRDGRLWRYRWRTDGDWVKPERPSAKGGMGVEIGHGWEGHLRVFTAPGAYSIEGYVRTQPRRTDGSGPLATLSLRPGDTVLAAASTFSPAYAVRLLRLERRTEEDRTAPSGLIDGVAAGVPQRIEASPGGHFKKAYGTRMHAQGARWPSDVSGLVLPRSAQSGIYAAEFTTPSGGRHLAPFVVKPPAEAKPENIAVIANVITWNAYNPWGGCSRDAAFEAGESPGGFCELSLDRPMMDPPLAGGASVATGLTDRDPRAFNQSVRAEVWTLSWLDSLAQQDPRYAYDVFSDVDLHAGIARLNEYKALVIQVRPEFWTDSMRDHLDKYLAAGGHLVFLGGRGLYDRVTITTDGKLRIRTAPARDLFRWASASYPDGRSERAVLGLAYERGERVSDPFLIGQAYKVDEPHAFFSQGIGLNKGAVLGRMKGLNHDMAAADGDVSWYQSGGVCLDAPNGSCAATHMTVAGARLASSTGGTRSRDPSNIVYRKTETGSGWVFAIGSLSVSGVLAIDPTMQRIVRNAFDAAIAGVAP